MSSSRTFKQRLATVSKHWDARDFDAAMAEVESARKLWPGNAHLLVLWASLIQLQRDPKPDLTDAKRALQQAVEFDKDSPAAAIELGHFLDNVEDNPNAASKAFADGIVAARQLLIEGLIGQAKVYQQLNKRDEFLRCLLEVLQLTRSGENGKKARTDDSHPDIIVESPPGHYHVIQLKGPYANVIHDLLSEPMGMGSS
jgi:tetratricopeptide (TPR) repeat protein